MPSLTGLSSTQQPFARMASAARIVFSSILQFSLDDALVLRQMIGYCGL